MLRSDFPIRIEHHILTCAKALAKNAQKTRESDETARQHPHISYVPDFMHNLETAHIPGLTDLQDPEERIVRLLDILVKSAKLHGFHQGFQVACDKYLGDDEYVPEN